MGAEFLLNPCEAWIWCCCGSIFFVVNLYLVPRKLRALPRSDPSQIKARYAAVGFTTLLAVLATSIIAREATNGPPVSRLIGVHTDQLIAAFILPLALTSCLFLGPLVTMACMARERSRYEVTPFGRARLLPYAVPWRIAVWAEVAKKANLDQGKYVVIRNLVVGPIAEEVVFRGCSVPLLLGAGVTRTKIVWLSPLLFGFAHVHHAVEWLRQGHKLPTVVAGMMFQMTYTSIFGAFAAFVQLRTGHLASSIMVHALCNFMGVPDFTFNVAPGNVRDSTVTSILYPHRRAMSLRMHLVVAMIFIGTVGLITSSRLEYDRVGLVPFRQLQAYMPKPVAGCFAVYQEATTTESVIWLCSVDTKRVDWLPRKSEANPLSDGFAAQAYSNNERLQIHGEFGFEPVSVFPASRTTRTTAPATTHQYEKTS